MDASAAAHKSERQHLETLESLKYARGKFLLMDQRKLPFEVAFDEVRTLEDVWMAIKEMRVRGAPAIAVTAVLGVAMAAHHKGDELATSVEVARKFLVEGLEYVSTSRPTAVNMFNAVTQFSRDVNAMAPSCGTGSELVNFFIERAEAYYNEDVAFNEGIMRHGAAHIMKHDAVAMTDTRVSVLTICNTGALATCRYGTALGVVRQLHYEGQLEQLYACETRPWNQGARLTVFECAQEGIPVTLICDSAVSHVMRTRKIHAVVVGADRICHNGDTANKIGTYNVAVAAKHHGVKFYVAAPSSTLDPHTQSGDRVEIEEREPLEITHNTATKQRCVADGPTVSVFNPVFDITPAALITGGIITEKGCFPPRLTEPYYDISLILSPAGSAV